MPSWLSADLAFWLGLVAAALASAWYLRRIGVLAVLPPQAGKKPGRASKAAPKSALGRDVSAVPAPIWFVAAAVSLLSLTLGASLAAGLPPDVRGPIGSLQHATINAAGAFGLGALVALLFLYLLAPRLSPAAGTRFEWRDLPVGLGAILLTLPFYLLTTAAAAWVSTHLFNQPPPKTAHTGLKLFTDALRTPWAWAFALVAVTLTPIAEEFIYRVFGQASLRALLGDSTARVWLAVIITSAIFAITHAAGGGPVPWAAVPGLFVLALGLGIAYEKTRRLGVPIVMHALFNFANLAFAAFSAAR